ncbi:hypothetical protein [Stagnihabitans tardus]|uniref:Uncharacterized protein n=1 Tax=Stagnihabitans tardus TaxID=2699202 RepID=A0AAE4YE52_9RHOB|nr:hypothetical protein [Stagnihabitans tardus]NBZ89663.1 hypothetical protein [Stagnihabitans tardus]
MSRLPLGLVLLASAVQAQEAPPPRLVLDLGLTGSQATNPDLSTPAESASDLGLRFGLAFASVTRDQSFLLSLGAAAQSGEGLSAPGLNLSYKRQGANAAVTLTASHTDAEAGAEDALTATGRVRDSDLAFTGQWGLQGRIGLDLSAQAHVKDYSLTTDPSVYDQASQSLGLGLTFRGLGAGDLSLSWRQTAADFDDLLQTDRESQSLSLSYLRPLDAATVLTVSLGTTEAETRKLGLVFARSNGLTGALALKRQMATGSAELGLQIERDANGARQTLQFARDLALASGKLSARIGYSSRSGDAGQAVGELTWSQELPSDSLSLSLSRQVALNEDEADTLRSTLGASWSHKLGENSQLGLSWGLSSLISAGTAAVDDATRQSLTASYGRALTPDWALRAGVTLTEIDRETTGTASDAAVFVTIGRKFVLLP